MIRQQKKLARDLVFSVFPNALCYNKKDIWYVHCKDDKEYKDTIGSGKTRDEAWESAAMSEIVIDRLENKIIK